MSKIGVNYPITKSPENGYFNLTSTSIEQVKINLLNILNTKKGERLYRPNFGTRLYTFQFLSNPETFKNKIKNEIRNVISNQAPYVSEEYLHVKIENSTAKIWLQFSTEFTGDDVENIMILVEYER